MEVRWLFVGGLVCGVYGGVGGGGGGC
eukprot:ctg_1824.g314